LGTYAVGGLSISAIMGFLHSNYAAAKRFQHGDSRLISESVENDSPKGAGKMKGLMTRPANIEGKLSGVEVVH